MGKAKGDIKSLTSSVPQVDLSVYICTWLKGSHCDANHTCKDPSSTIGPNGPELQIYMGY